MTSVTIILFEKNLPETSSSFNSLRTEDVFPVVASLPPKIYIFLETDFFVKDKNTLIFSEEQVTVLPGGGGGTPL